MGSVERFREEGKLYDQHAHKYRYSVASAPHERIPLDTILVGVSGTRIDDQNNYAITHLRFCFRLMTPSSSFLISSEKKCEINTMGAHELGQGDRLDDWSEDESEDEDEDYDQMYNYEYYDEYEGRDDPPP